MNFHPATLTVDAPPHEAIAPAQFMSHSDLLTKAEWRDLKTVWFAIGATLALAITYPPAAGTWYALWILWAIRNGGRLVPALLFGAVPVTYSVVPIGVNLSVVEVGLLLSGLVSLGSATRRMGSLFGPVAAYLTVCLLSMAIDYRGNVAISSFIQSGVYLLLAVSVFSHFVRSDRQLLTAAVSVMGTTLFLSVMVTVLGGGGYLWGLHKNGVGATTSVGVVCAMAIWLHSRQSRQEKNWTPAFAILLLGLFFSLSRGAWAGAAVGGIFLAAVYRQWRVLWSMAIIAVPVAVVGFSILPDHHQEYVLGSVDTDTHSYQTRDVNAKTAWQFFSSNPIIGSGIGIRKQHDATNIVLFTMAETGLLGLFAFGLIHAEAGKALWRSYRIAKPGSLTLMAAALAMALLFGRLMHGMVDHYWSRGAISAAWASVGAAMALTAAAKREEKAMLPTYYASRP